MSMKLRMMFCVLVFSFSAAAAPLDVSQLVEKLAGPDDHARAAARQVLSHKGVEVIPDLIPLLSHAEPSVSKTAYTVIWEIVNEAAGPGLEAERARAVGFLMPLLAGHQAAEIKIAAMRLLAVAIPDGSDVTPIGQLLHDPDLREKARTTLQRIETREARAALREALDGADEEFTCALLDALADLHDAESVPRAIALMAHTDARVRAAAARAVAWTGDPRLAEPLLRVRDAATPDTAFEATDAVLDLAEAIAEEGGNWEHAIALYRNVLDTAQDGALKSAAMIGLGKYGDETVVETLSAAARKGGPALEKSIVPAFEALQGRGVGKAMLAAYATFSPDVRLALIEMFARRRDALFLPVLAEAAGSSDSQWRVAGIEALAAAGLAEGMDVLLAAARSGNEQDRALAVEAARRVAETLRLSGDAAAGKAFLGLYALAEDDAARLEVLSKLAQCPVPEAFDVVMEAISAPSLKDVAAKALLPVAEVLMAAGQGEKALKAYEKLSQTDVSPETLVRVADRMKQLGAAVDVAKRLGFVTRWWLIGPFQWSTEGDWEKPFVGEPGVNPGSTSPDGDTDRAWQRYETTDSMGVVDLIGAVAQEDTCFAYAYAEIAVGQDMDAVCRVGSDDGDRLWVNGELVLDNRVDRPLALDQDKVGVKLKAGVNRLLLKISQGAGGWAFCLRVTTPDGLGVPFEQAEPAPAS